MSIEIERKFLVRHLPAAIFDDPGTVIRQGYLIVAGDGTELRVRQKSARFFQTIKTGEGLARTEIEIELSREQFDRLWPHTGHRRVTKTRRRWRLGEWTAEVDCFEGPLAGLLLVEVEFPSAADSRAFHPPDWFGAEVTDDRRYKNQSLAVHGLPCGPAG